MRGDDGWDARLGEALAWPSVEGEAGLTPPFEVDSCRFNGICMTGLFSNEGDGEDAVDGVVPVAVPLLWACMASALSF